MKQFKKIFLSGAFALCLIAPSMAKAQSTNVTINPLGFLIGFFNVNAGFAVTDKVLVGPSLGYASYGTGDATASALQLGAYGEFYLSQTFGTDSWIANTSLSWARISSGDDSTSGISASATAGYRWFWASGFDLGLALGLQYAGFDLAEVGVATISAIGPAITFDLGVAF